MPSKYSAFTVDIYFEPEHVACNYCPLLETYSRNMCRRTGEYIIDPRYIVGNYCPLKPMNEEDQHNGV